MTLVDTIHEMSVYSELVIVLMVSIGIKYLLLRLRVPSFPCSSESALNHPVVKFKSKESTVSQNW